VRAFVVTGPGEAGVIEVPDLVAAPGEVVVDVERVGLCGTDVEFFTGHMAYLHEGHAQYPMRLGHEWCGVVAQVGEGVDPGWLGQRVTADTMLGCGRCRLCLSGRQHVCAERAEIGIRSGWPGALAEQVPAPATALYPLPANVSVSAGALVEPGANALRAALAAAEGPVTETGGSVLVCGPGTIGLLTALFLRSMGVDVHLAGRTQESLDFARSLGLTQAWPVGELPDHPFDAVVDCTTAEELPQLAVDVVQPGGRVVYIGLSSAASLVDSRALVFKDLTVVGVLSASPALSQTIEAYAAGLVDPVPLVAATVGLTAAADALAGVGVAARSPAPKVHVNPKEDEA
jgi:threonine dehydrogenase-like Zn-dependent dehydrogenase